ncbi:MAG TPA: hypothetical protein VLX91_03910 [Candidatus Acidoferrales bacterium]|nr:hypothetical protein [Candidatus Acidoferrales bacterium]
MSLTGDYSDCNGATWSPADPLTLTVVSGSQYVSFHQRDSQTGGDTKIGLVVTTTGKEIGQYSLVADGINPDSSGSWATVQAVSDGMTRTDSVQVCQLLDHFSVYTDPDTIAHSRRGNIYVQAENSTGSDIVIPWSTPLYITADDSGKYGEVYDWGVSSPYPYSDACAGMLYNADGGEPNGVQKITISVTDVNDPTKTATGSLFVEGDIVVEVVPSVISPGDTAAITAKQRNPDGSLTDFPPNQSFEVGIDSGNGNGTILSNDSTSGYFSSASQPFQFIAADSIGADSVNVEIRVGIPNEIATSILPGRKGNSGQNMKVKRPTISAGLENSGLRKSASNVGPNATGRKSVSDENNFTLSDYGIGWVEIQNGNHRPIIKSISYSPSRRYFSYDSVVSVSAVVFDPDGDSVTVKYEPGQQFKLENLGANIVKVTATDSKGASTVKYDTIYAVYVDMEPSDEVVKDGENMDFQAKVYPNTITANSFEWSWSPDNPDGGNDPFVDFEPGSDQQKVTVKSAKWYAFPDHDCHPPSNQTSTYDLKTLVKIKGDEFDQKGNLNVFLPRLGGEETHAYIIGNPYAVPVYDNSGNIKQWRIFSIGTLERVVDKPVVNLPTTSQFYTKLITHENIHQQQWISGMAMNLWSVDELYKRIRTITAKSLPDIAAKVSTVRLAFESEQIKAFEEIYNLMELEAYNVSDQIPPKYYYQRCDRTDFLTQN